ncbi:MAG: hypothetical protein ABI405_10780 [Parafilimonas sp.]
MSKPTTTVTPETTSDTSASGTSSGTGTGGSGPKGGPHPKRVAEMILLVIILGFVIYNTYMITQQGKILQSLQLVR